VINIRILRTFIYCSLWYHKKPFARRTANIVC